MNRNWNSVLEAEDKNTKWQKHWCKIDTFLKCRDWGEDLVISQDGCCNSTEWKVNFCPMCGYQSTKPVAKNN